MAHFKWPLHINASKHFDKIVSINTINLIVFLLNNFCWSISGFKTSSISATVTQFQGIARRWQALEKSLIANFLVDFAHTCSIRWSVPKSIFINENWIKEILLLDGVKRASFFLIWISAPTKCRFLIWSAEWVLRSAAPLLCHSGGKLPNKMFVFTKDLFRVH